MSRNRSATLAVLTLALVLVTGCRNPFAPAIGEVEIRVENASAHLMEDIMVGFPYEGGDVSYGDLPANAVSDYRTVQEAYRYAAVRLVVDGDTLGITPIDYVGETPLEGGKYTYRLGLADGTNLTLELVEE